MENISEPVELTEDETDRVSGGDSFPGFPGNSTNINIGQLFSELANFSLTFG